MPKGSAFFRFEITNRAYLLCEIINPLLCEGRSADVKRQNYKTFSYRSNWFLFAIHESEAAPILLNRRKAPATQW